MTRNAAGRPKDIEIWTSVKSATEAADFTKIASATLKNEDSLQPVAFTPVEARFVKLRILNTNAPEPPYKPGDLPAAASRSPSCARGRRASDLRGADG